MRVLVVDDDEVGRATLCEILALEGYDVDQASGGAEALEKLQSQTYQLMLLDLKMPEVDGIDVLRRVSGTAPDLQVVILTAHGSMDSAIQAVRHGAYDYLLKPASTREIVETLRRAGAQWEQRSRDLRLADAVTRGELASSDAARLALGDVEIDVGRRRIEGGAADVDLTPAELRLLVALYDERGRVLTYDSLVQHVQGYTVEAWEAAGMLRPVVSRVRRKLRAAGLQGEWITTVRGSGYLLSDRPAVDD